MASTILKFPPNPSVVCVHNDGGPALMFPEVNLIFWGKAWSADPVPTSVLWSHCGATATGSE